MVNQDLPAPIVERLWQSARFIPSSVRMLGTRYRILFSVYAHDSSCSGAAPAVADALGFIDFMFQQNRMALLPQEHAALKRDARRLRRHYRLQRQGATLSVTERWKILRWLGI